MLKLLLLVCVSLSSALADTLQCSSSNAGTFRFSVSSRRNQTGGWMVLVHSDRDATPGHPTTLTVDVEQETRSCEDGEHIHMVTVATMEQSTVISPGTDEVEETVPTSPNPVHSEVISPGTDQAEETVPTSPIPVHSAASACREYSKMVDSKQCFIDRGTALNRSKAESKEFPHMVLIGYLAQLGVIWHCDGVLISPRFVLTVAEWVDPTIFGSRRWVRIGDLVSSQTTYTMEPQDVAVVEAILHPDYKNPVLNNNIALLRLEKDVEMNEFVRPACLHTGGDVEGRTGIVTGWGQRDFASLYPSKDLMRAEQHIQPMEKCGSISRTNSASSESMVCVGGERSTCVTRRGSPIQLIRDDTECMYDIVGLTSFREGCGTLNSFEVHTRVSYYVPWIEKIVWGTDYA